jgi:hypothetical protein
MHDIAIEGLSARLIDGSAFAASDRVIAAP